MGNPFRDSLIKIIDHPTKVMDGFGLGLKSPA
jgi:hypothetical protein